MARAQIWGMDLIAAVMIFSVALSFFYFYAINDRDLPLEKLETLTQEGILLTDMLLSEGYPTNWDESNVIEIGILSNGIVNETKLERFYNLATNDYYHTKNIFNVGYDYYVFFNENMSIGGSRIDGIGKPGVTRKNINAKNLIRINRVTVYRGKLTSLTAYIWEE